MRSTAHLRLGPTPPSGTGHRSDARIVDARCEPPYAVRRAGGRVLVAASAAGPLGGDHFRLSLDVDPDTIADVGTVGAAMVMPGPTGSPSSSRTDVTLGENARLVWWPEPTISVAGSDHDLVTRVRLAHDATCTIVEEVALGRSDELSGRLRSSVRVERDGRTIVHHAEDVGPAVPGAGSVVSVGAARHVVTAVVVGGDARVAESATIVPEPPTAVDATFGARIRVEDDVALVLVAAPDRPAALDAARRLGLDHRSRSLANDAASDARTRMSALV